jgi:RHS repeat-associated protein
LINDQVPSEFRRYEYDCFDNRLEEHRQGKIWKTWHYDSANRIVEEKDSQGQQRIYEHDRRGNLVRRGQDTFLYDAGSRLRRVYQAGSNHALLEFSYSATGQRTLITNKFDVEWVIFDKLNEIISISPNCERVTYWGLQADQALAYSKNTPANISPVFTDASHSLIRVMGEQDECKYDPFGNPINNISKDFHFGFNGKRYYPELDFYENRARFYDPNCGRFTQPDPLGIKSDGPNLYHYARNNPIQFIDTLGLKSQQTSYGKISNLLSGGHLVEKHVGKSLDYLQQRLATENINVASSFTNLQSANKVIAATLDNSQKDIDRWLENGLSPRLSVEYSGSSKIGYGIIRGESDVRSFSDASIVLERSSSSSAGFFILTGYPTPS